MIVLGCPVRDRAWILPTYLEHISNLDHPKKDILLCFIVNDSEDNTTAILDSFAAARSDEYAGILILQRDLGQPKDTRVASVRKKIYHGLAQLRNMLLDRTCELGASHLFSVDSDILVCPHTLDALIADEKDIVAAQIWNDQRKTYPNIMIRRGDHITHYRNFPKDSLFKCDVTGAVYLLSRRVCETVRYSYHDQGEDVGFCLDAAEKGFEIWADTRVTCNHVIVKEVLTHGKS